MKKQIILIAIIGIAFSNAWTQNSDQTLKLVQKLAIPRAGGANGAQVAWHPVEKKYYAAMAGNKEFCLAVYDQSGSRVSLESQQTLFDIRGLWYNPLTKSLQMNGFNESGWAEYQLDNKGIPTGVRILREGMNQPFDNSTGAFSADSNLLYFIDDITGDAQSYNFQTGQYKSVTYLFLGYRIDDDDADMAFENDDVLSDYNLTNPIFTGIKGAELGLLNVTDKEIELYDLSTGYVTLKLALPEDAPVNEWLNFSYCNGIYWLFDTNARIWLGYQ